VPTDISSAHICGENAKAAAPCSQARRLIATILISWIC
jgi:hypothetical protein